MGRADARHALRTTIVTALLLAAPVEARADGAFPDAQNILLPVDRPAQVILPTNFGVVFTEDGGHSWLWTCEQDLNSFGWLYQIGLPPRRRIFAVANGLLVYSDDMTCGWHVAGGALAGQDVSDAWVDRKVPDRVFAIGARCCGGGSNNNIYSAFASQDGGATFAPALYVAASGDAINGIESAASDPATVYLALSMGATFQATLAQSSDSGATWRFNSLASSLGKGNVRLIAVDPVDANKVFLLWNDPVAGQGVAVTEDGGATATMRIAPTGDGAVVKAFVRTASGALLVATDRSGAATLYRSIDGGKRFDIVTGPPHIRGLAERGGVVYASADNFGDGFALATSTDDGTTWKAVMAYGDVTAIPGCLKSACQSACALAAPLLWSADICTADAAVVPIGGASGAGGRAADGGAGAGGAVAPPSGGSPARRGGGCRVLPADGETAWTSFSPIVALTIVLACCRRRRKGGGSVVTAKGGRFRRRRPLQDRTWCGTRRASAPGDRGRE